MTFLALAIAQSLPTGNGQPHDSLTLGLSANDGVFPGPRYESPTARHPERHQNLPLDSFSNNGFGKQTILWLSITTDYMP